MDQSYMNDNNQNQNNDNNHHNRKKRYSKRQNHKTRGRGGRNGGYHKHHNKHDDMENMSRGSYKVKSRGGRNSGMRGGRSSHYNNKNNNDYMNDHMDDGGNGHGRSFRKHNNNYQQMNRDNDHNENNSNAGFQGGYSHKDNHNNDGGKRNKNKEQGGMSGRHYKKSGYRDRRDRDIDNTSHYKSKTGISTTINNTDMYSHQNSGGHTDRDSDHGGNGNHRRNKYNNERRGEYNMSNKKNNKKKKKHKKNKRNGQNEFQQGPGNSNFRETTAQDNTSNHGNIPIDSDYNIKKQMQQTHSQVPTIPQSVDGSYHNSAQPMPVRRGNNNNNNNQYPPQSSKHLPGRVPAGQGNQINQDIRTGSGSRKGGNHHQNDIYNNDNMPVNRGNKGHDNGGMNHGGGNAGYREFGGRTHKKSGLSKQHSSHTNNNYSVPVESHEVGRFDWEINAFYFKKAKKEDYEAYHTLEEVKELIAQDRAFKGTIYFEEGFNQLGIIKSDDFVKKVYAKHNNINRALNGCEVTFMPISSGWEEFLVINQLDEIENLEKLENEELGEMKRGMYSYRKRNNYHKNNSQHNVVEVKIIYIDRNPLFEKNIVVKIRKDQIHGLVATYIYDSNYPYFSVKQGKTDMLLNDKNLLHHSYFFAKFEKWSRSQKYPTVSILKRFGQVGIADVECQCLIEQYGIQAQEYPESSISKLRKELGRLIDKKDNLKVTPEEIEKRTDLRDKLIFTIDPKEAKDLDDALSIEKINEDVFEVGVHIADVSHFVKFDTYIDKEASRRGNSFYFPHRVYPMLPKILSDNLCSLNSGVDRLAFSVFFKINHMGERVDRDPRIEKTIIKSKIKLSYEVAQGIINGTITTSDQFPHREYPIYDTEFGDLVKALKIMNKLAKQRRLRRLENGSLFFNNKEKKKFDMNETMTYPIGWDWEIKSSANEMVEEFMLLANVNIAEILYENFPELSILRAHPHPDWKNLSRIESFFKKIGGYNIDLDSNESVSKAIMQINNMGNINEVKKNFLHFTTMQMLKSAKYVVSGKTIIDNFHHFALNFPLYTHFTSPIRRYPDLVVHRMLTWLLEGKNPRDFYETTDLIRVCRVANQAHYNGKKASQKADEIFMLMLLRERHMVVKALVVDISGSKLELFIDEFFFCKTVVLSYSLYHVDLLEDGSTLIKACNRKYRAKKGSKKRQNDKEGKQIVVKVSFSDFSHSRLIWLFS